MRAPLRHPGTPQQVLQKSGTREIFAAEQVAFHFPLAGLEYPGLARLGLPGSRVTQNNINRPWLDSFITPQGQLIEMYSVMES